ncbi:MAG: universal stress protein [Thermodesulfobacteriota bacterium]
MRMQKILVPVDGSVSSKNTAKYAATLAAAKNALVVLLHVHDRVPMTIGGEAAQSVRRALAEDSAKLLAEFAAIVEGAGAKCVPMTREGDPGHVIVHVQEEEACDIIVMGSRGLTNLEGLVLGSATNKVLHLAACPVLVTRNLRKKYLESPFFE